MPDKKVNENIGIKIVKGALIIVPIVISLSAWQTSREANRIASDISKITNRPYILINNIVAKRGTRPLPGADIRLPVEYHFTFLNNGTLPAWVMQYEIYTNGIYGPIHLIFDKIVQPAENFTIAKNRSETRGYLSMLIQKPGEKNGHVDSFEAEKHKMLLIIVTYKTMGDTDSENLFTTWQLAKFGIRQNIECGTNSLTREDIQKLFEKQEKIFELNEAR